jgi:hypothetical protein
LLDTGAVAVRWNQPLLKSTTTSRYIIGSTLKMSLNFGLSNSGFPSRNSPALDLLRDESILGPTGIFHDGCLKYEPRNVFRKV